MPLRIAFEIDGSGIQSREVSDTSEAPGPSRGRFSPWDARVPMAREGFMGSVSRRKFIVGGSVGVLGASSLGAAGVAALGAAGSGEQQLDPRDLEAAPGPLVVRIRDAAAGEVEVLIDDRSIVLTDKALVAKVLRATR
jgi:hypothetical protein